MEFTLCSEKISHMVTKKSVVHLSNLVKLFDLNLHTKLVITVWVPNLYHKKSVQHKVRYFLDSKLYTLYSRGSKFDQRLLTQNFWELRIKLHLRSTVRQFKCSTVTKTMPLFLWVSCMIAFQSDVTLKREFEYILCKPWLIILPKFPSCLNLAHQTSWPWLTWLTGLLVGWFTFLFVCRLLIPVPFA